MRLISLTTILGAAAVGLFAAPALAQMDKDGMMGGMMDKAKAAGEMKNACPQCKMAMEQMRTMKKVDDLLAEAKKDAESARDTAAADKIAQAQVLLAERHEAMHKEMKEHMETMHKDMKGDPPACPMCGQPMNSDPQKTYDVVNDKCPITGKSFDPRNVPADRVRHFEGKAIGFCCPNCPPAWDKLTKEQKEAKLSEVMGKTEMKKPEMKMPPARIGDQ